MDLRGLWCCLDQGIWKDRGRDLIDVNDDLDSQTLSHHSHQSNLFIYPFKSLNPNNTTIPSLSPQINPLTLLQIHSTIQTLSEWNTSWQICYNMCGWIYNFSCKSALLNHCKSVETNAWINRKSILLHIRKLCIRGNKRSLRQNKCHPTPSPDTNFWYCTTHFWIPNIRAPKQFPRRELVTSP